MGNRLDTATEAYIKHLINQGEGQREIERQTGCSRVTIRRIARAIGHSFPINGIDIIPSIVMCGNCGALIRRPASKIKRAKHSFCDEICKNAFMTGPRHPHWNNGARSRSFSEWATNQAEYKNFREEVLRRDNYRCMITGRKDSLQVHHILPKNEKANPELVFSPSNGITLCKDIHEEIHKEIRSGEGFKEVLEKLSAKYQQERERNLQGVLDV